MKTSIELIKHEYTYGTPEECLLCLSFTKSMLGALPDKILFTISTYAFEDAKKIKINIKDFGTVDRLSVVWFDPQYEISNYPYDSMWRNIYGGMCRIIKGIFPPNTLGEEYIYVKICALTQT